MNAKSMPAGFCLFAFVLLAQVAPARHDAAPPGTKAVKINFAGAGSATADQLFQPWIEIATRE